VSADEDAVYDHLAALRASVAANAWSTAVDVPVVTLFNALLARAKVLRPNAGLLRVIEPQKPHVRAHTLLTLADQILLALER
jgi:hypothetical protein